MKRRRTRPVPALRAALGAAATVAAAWSAAPRPAAAGASPAVEDAIVKIYTVTSAWDHFNPWMRESPRSRTGSGCIVAGRRILTNAHVVSDQTYVQVRGHGDAERFEARVVDVAHDADLALLTVDDPRFFEGRPALPLGPLPLPQDEVHVLGFPDGGDALSVTRGILSRVEHRTYAHGSSYLLAGQLDAAINPGNSGGPVVKDGAVVGVVMQAIRSAENIGYMVPSPVVEHVLADMDDGSYDGFPALGVITQVAENPDLRRMHGLGDGQTGIVVIRVLPGGAAEGLLEVGDVLLAVDDAPIANDGTAELRPKERTSYVHLVQRHAIGESARVRILRRGAGREVVVPLAVAEGEDWLVAPEQYDVTPSYVVHAGLVLARVTKSYLEEWGSSWRESAPDWLLAKLGGNFRSRRGEEVVVVSQVLASSVNEGYHDLASWVVERIDGEEVLNLAHAVDLLERSTDAPFLVLEGEDAQLVVLDRARARGAGPRILETYHVPADRSADLVRP